ncbi:hypothetical protein B0T26DRAFT_713027 [Lasiosphaeria miniovina]|uniref:Secreted protein n=1 Tax=Lasiosphaeria miniovina TaxID=1954250 RepID=A0AA40AMD1_9PEZI|nr:uncharacterized protein B0T26DRAFT_713027 [Lasiosphaeria miniovina]KAK0718377.1 hypothetical protein B0T26DRAFT_713027 [Lasiosphaeria miniovina]
MVGVFAILTAVVVHGIVARRRLGSPLLKDGDKLEPVGGNVVLDGFGRLDMERLHCLGGVCARLGQERLPLAIFGPQHHGLVVAEGLLGNDQGEDGIRTAEEPAVLCVDKKGPSATRRVT